MFKGKITFDLVTAMISSLEERLEKLEINKRVKKKFYNVATECIQNLYYHLTEITSDSDEELINSYDAHSGLIIIAARKRFYNLQTENYIPTEKIEEIRKRLDVINSAGADELREIYKKTLMERDFSDKGTAGLGFIDIARKTNGQELRYRFRTVTPKISYFNFQVKLPRREEN